MKIAVTYENGQVYQHFGHTQFFKIYDIQDSRLVSSQVIATGTSGHASLAGLLADQGVQVLICGGLGGCARTALEEAHIAVYGGVQGEADAVIDALLHGGLDYDPDARCTHHEEGHSCGHHEGGHTCGGHRDHSEGHTCGHCHD